jgi:WhiB family redox-sensing transcriptional regulator
MQLKDDWPLLAACRTGDPDALFVEGAAQHIAKRICFGCPVQYECLAEALDSRTESGVWGGMTERERRSLLRNHPEVASWRRLFLATPSTLHGIHPRAAVAHLLRLRSALVRAAGRWPEARQSLPVGGSSAQEEARSSSAPAR